MLAVFLAVSLSSATVEASSATTEQKNALLKHAKRVPGGGMKGAEKEKVHEPHHRLHHSAAVEATVNAVRAAQNRKVSDSKPAKHTAHERKVNAVQEKVQAASHHKTTDSFLEVGDKSLAKDTLRSQAHAHAHARAKAAQMASLMGGFPGMAFGRGRGGYQRGGGFVGPSEFDNSWWQPPPSVGGDPFLQGYSQKVSPQHLFGYGGMPGGGFGTAHHYWGQGAYKYPMNQPWWRGRSSAAYAPAASRGVSPYLPYQTPRDSFGLRQPGMGANLPVSSPYYYTPPPLQGDWNLPRNPVAPPAEAGAKATTATEGSTR